MIRKSLFRRLETLETRIMPTSQPATIILQFPLALAQSFTASVRGVVTDASHSAIPGAKVTVTDVDRNVSQKATTDNAGWYVFTALPPGNYSLGTEPGLYYSRAAFPLQVQQ